MAASGKGNYTEDPGDGKRPATSPPDSPYVKPDLGKGKGPAQPNNTDRPDGDARKKPAPPKRKDR
jgi:hypothetical protein